ncbi:glycosyltransferase family 2 protein [Butyrivibrio sp. VCB2001]|uniref:glycosyltransferase family 2 protein n=1 Tax=Butyrivibrio sp. VCB2001 TaxID=1280667 RepID=UPI00040C9FAF|nr:glycosyltransferase family 2 protein [Butyrivibrio sp. VCB2001]
MEHMVSVIMPAYNAQVTCEKSIKSVLNQTYKDFELIIINDGSSDNTEEKCKNLITGHENARVITQNNQGVSAARNNGIQNATGKYIAFIDSDDEYKETFLEKMVGAAEAEDADLVLCGFSEMKGTEEHVMYIPEACGSKKDYCNHLLKKIAGASGLNIPWNKLYRRDKIQYLFNTQTQMGEDLEFVCKYIADIGKVTSVQESLYYYDTNMESSLTSHLDLKLRAISADMLVMMELTDNVGLSQNIVKNKFYDRIEGILKPLNRNDYKEALRFLYGEEKFVRLLNWAPDRAKNKFIRFCLVHHCINALFLYLSAKKGIKGILK